MEIPSTWQVVGGEQPPLEFQEAIASYFPQSTRGNYLAQVLWQRGIQDPQKVAGFLCPEKYQPTSPFAFGEEMEKAVYRLQQARVQLEKVTIWGDFDADGVTATAVLLDGLGQFFDSFHLDYYIPNRLTESHGLNVPGIERLAQQKTTLIVTCDTGSTNLAEIELAQNLGIDLIVTDHHTLPDCRPPLTAIINPRYFPPDHPLFHLSGVAVAYKLIEALYQRFPEIPQAPLADLLDLVAIGLIADLVQLKGDCRYLAQQGIDRLQKDFQQPPHKRRRPGIGQLLDLCKKQGDRPTDISFGIGPRINAVSRIYGDATFCVNLLTHRDVNACQKWAEAAELANTRRKEIQQMVAQEVLNKIAQLDLSTTPIIILEQPEWPLGVLGLVASQIAQDYQKPTILLTRDYDQEHQTFFAKGSARSVANIDLYELVKTQAHLLHRFGGHPFAAGLSLPLDNLSLFTEGISQTLNQTLLTQNAPKQLEIDLQLTVAELGKDLFQELKKIEPCGMGNPVPRLLIKNCWFEDVNNTNIRDYKGGKVRYIKTEFILKDKTCSEGIHGSWWGHHKEDIPVGRCDVVVELDYNEYQKYHVRIVDILGGKDSIIEGDRHRVEAPLAPTILSQETSDLSALKIWETLVGIAKYLSENQQPVSLEVLQKKLQLSPLCVQLGLRAIAEVGFKIETEQNSLTIRYSPAEKTASLDSIYDFIAGIKEEQFRYQYWREMRMG